MKQLIYYPGFEVRDINWLKFALLYLNNLDPIVTEAGDGKLSDLYKRLLADTDLIQLHRPKDEEALVASRNASNEVERILKRPSTYGIDDSVMQKWRNSENHDDTLWQGKYSDDWATFCLNNGFASKFEGGLKVPKQLALIYMSFLAQVISDEREIPAITDDTELDRLFIRARRAGPRSMNKFNLAKATIALRLPANIEDIDIVKIIRFREKPGFKDRLSAFHDQLEVFTKALENWNGLPERDFLHSLGSPIRDFQDEIIRLGTGAAPVTLGAYLLVSAATPSELEALKVAAAGAAFIGSNVVALKNAWRNTKTKRYVRKYVADLSQLHPHPR